MTKQNKKLEKGLIQIFIGDGRGKTTAAMGTAIRAAGHGLRVAVFQFLKGGGFTGEFLALKKLGNIQIYQYGPTGPSKKYTKSVKEGKARVGREYFIYTKKDIEKERRGLKLAEKKISSGKYDLVVLDELIDLIWFKHATENEIVKVLNKKHPKTEVILTGHIKPAKILRMAEYISEVKKIRHPFDKKIQARWGIDY